MTKKSRGIALLILSIISTSIFLYCYQNKELIDAKFYEFEGRIAHQSQEHILYWSGSSVKLKFYGTTLYADLKDEFGENDYQVIIDKDSSYLLKIGTSKEPYLLAELPLDTHTVELFKRTEYDRGHTVFNGFYSSEKIIPLAFKPKKQRIVFYGNSITAAYSVDDYSGKDSPDGPHTNCLHSYAYLTALHFDASYQLICKSGIGITVSWFPYIAEDIYDKINPIDKKSIYGFEDKADVVLINLGQNDCWLTKMLDNPEHQRVFGNTIPDSSFLINAYKNYLAKIRKKHPSAHIICAIGAMDASSTDYWPNIIKTAVIKSKDLKAYPFVFPYNGTGQHPKIEEQKKMAKQLIQFINEKNFL